MGSADEVKHMDQIISFLKPQYPTTYLLFLEHLVIETELQIEKYHTQLALAYLENIRKAGISKEVNERNGTFRRPRPLIKEGAGRWYAIFY